MQKLAKVGFSLVLVAAMVVGFSVSFGSAAEAMKIPSSWNTCPIYLCSSPSSGSAAGSCLYYDRQSDCLFSCAKRLQGSTYCKTSCIPL